MRRLATVVAMSLVLVSLAVPPARAAEAQPGDATEVKLVALTFDDGPSPYTARIIDTLRIKGATATFFMTGRNARRYKSIARSVGRGGFAVGNHSFGHGHLIDWGYKPLSRDLGDAQSAIRNTAGVTPRWYKPPYMEWNQAYDLLLPRLRLGLCWPDCAPDDWSGAKSAQQIADDICADVRPGTVIGLHDGSPDGLGDRSATADAVGMIVDRLHAQGYTFVKLEALPSAVPGRP